MRLSELREKALCVEPGWALQGQPHSLVGARASGIIGSGVGMLQPLWLSKASLLGELELSKLTSEDCPRARIPQGSLFACLW